MRTANHTGTPTQPPPSNLQTPPQRRRRPPPYHHHAKAKEKHILSTINHRGKTKSNTEAKHPGNLAPLQPVTVHRTVPASPATETCLETTTAPHNAKHERGKLKETRQPTLTAPIACGSHTNHHQPATLQVTIRPATNSRPTTPSKDAPPDGDRILNKTLTELRKKRSQTREKSFWCFYK